MSRLRKLAAPIICSSELGFVFRHGMADHSDVYAETQRYVYDISRYKHERELRSIRTGYLQARAVDIVSTICYSELHPL